MDFSALLSGSRLKREVYYGLNLKISISYIALLTIPAVFYSRIA